MHVLMLGLYAEGRTDERFLPIIIQRATEHILMQYDRPNIEANEPEIIKINKDRHHMSKAECIRSAARKARGYHALIVHSDADDLTYQQAYNERFKPGYDQIQTSEEYLCKDLIPLIPVRMVEAWMLADPEALQKTLDTHVNFDYLKAKNVGSYTNPKDTIDWLIRANYPGYPKLWTRIKGELYAKLAPVIKLESLQQVPAYKRFEIELSRTLKSLNLIQ